MKILLALLVLLLSSCAGFDADGNPRAFMLGPNICVGSACGALLQAPVPNFPVELVVVDDPHYTCKLMGAVPQTPNNVPLAFLNITHEAPIYGCADVYGRIKPKTCTVWIGKDAPDWLIDHEIEHCKKGYTHASWRSPGLSSFPGQEFWK